jgi:hypothetical protein
MMRSPQQVLFPWAYDDRSEEISRFREMATRWRPVVRTERDDDFGAFASLSFGADNSPARESKPRVRPAWSPWLWVK